MNMDAIIELLIALFFPIAIAAVLIVKCVILLPEVFALPALIVAIRFVDYVVLVKKLKDFNKNFCHERSGGEEPCQKENLSICRGRLP